MTLILYFDGISTEERDALLVRVDQSDSLVVIFGPRGFSALTKAIRYLERRSQYLLVDGTLLAQISTATDRKGKPAHDIPLRHALHGLAEDFNTINPFKSDGLSIETVIGLP